MSYCSISSLIKGKDRVSLSLAPCLVRDERRGTTCQNLPCFIDGWRGDFQMRWNLVETTSALESWLEIARRTKINVLSLFGWLFINVLVNYQAISRTGPKTERLIILRAATHETQLGDHDFCLSRSHYTDTDPTSRERAATAAIEPGTSSPGVARYTDWAIAPPPPPPQVC